MRAEALRLAGPIRTFRLNEDIAPPDLAPGQAHVWIARLDALHAHVGSVAAVLDATERARAAKFRFDRDRQLYGLGRMTLRRVLAAYLGIAPAEVPIRAGLHGKPELAPPAVGSALHFNVSHSGDLALYAVSRDGPLGVDVEQVRAVPDLEGVAELVLSPREKAVFIALSPTDRHAFFHEAWSRKEAYLKARGDGLTRSPTAIEFGALLGEPGEAIRDLENAPACHRWRIAAWQPEAGYWSALVTTTFTDHASIYELKI